jgi:hypothetical protein
MDVTGWDVTLIIQMQVAKEEKLTQLEKILHGRSLQGSENLKAFLRFVVDRAIEGQESQLKEYVIATEVFGRGKGFDSRIDSVVRVQAGRLRTKLQEYYATEGKDDEIVIDLPKGQYTPVFSYARRSDESESNGEGPSVPASPASDAPVLAVAGVSPVNQIDSSSVSTEGVWRESKRVAGPRSFWRRISSVVALVSLLLTVIFGLLTLHYRAKSADDSLLPGAGETEAMDRSVIEPLWGDLLRSPEPVLVVYSNTLFKGTAEEGMKLLKSLDAPGSSLGSPVIPQSEIEQVREPVIDLYTGIGEVMGSYYLGDFFARVRHASRVKRSLLLTWEEVKTQNVVVLGSPAENLFLRDLPQKQDFIFKPILPPILPEAPDLHNKGKKVFGIVNTKPRPGEQEFYIAKQDGPSRSQISEDYAVVSLLEGLSGDNRLLILAGITTIGTQASVEYVTQPEYMRDLIRHLNMSPAGSPPKLPDNYQILLRVKVNGGVPVQVSYVTHHVLNQ